MRNLTLTQDYIQELSAKTGFKDNGDVDFQNSVLYVDDNDSIVAAIVVGNITHVPALGKALPENVKDEKGSAQVLLLYIDNDSSSHLLPFKILWCNNSEYTSEELLKRLGFQYHINGITNTYYIMIN